MSSTSTGHAGRGWFYLPVMRQGTRYVEVPEAERASPDLATVPELDDYLRQHHDTTECEVELAGRNYIANVHVSRDGDDFSYVIVDDGGMPVDMPAPDPIAFDRVREYLDWLSLKVSCSEAISPVLSLDVLSEFIFPSFVEVDPEFRTPIAERSWAHILQRPRCVILGEAGIGKTTCLRRMTLEYSSRLESSRPLVPIYMQLRSWRGRHDLFAALREQLAHWRAEWLGANLEAAAESGQLVLLLDGLDELPVDMRSYVSGVIAKTAAQYSRLSIVISSREIGDDWRFSGFAHHRMKPFTESQLAECAFYWLGRNDAGVWRDFISRLWGQPELRRLACNPLMLSVAAYLHGYNSLPPNNKSLLVGEYVDAVVDTWDQVRGIVRSPAAWASPSSKLSFLCRLAYESLMAGKPKFSDDDFVAWNRNWVSQEVVAQVLPLLGTHTGLVKYEPGSATWSFSDSYFGAYLAARQLIERTDDVTVFFRERIVRHEWQDVWLLACGITRDASHLIRLVGSTSRLDAITRATLLASAFSQSITVDHAIVDESCVAVISALERSMEHMLLAEDLPKEPVEQAASPPLWSIAFKRDPESSGEHIQLNRLLCMLRALYEARVGVAGSRLRELMKRSRLRSVSAFAACFEVDGEYCDRIVPHRTGELLQILVLRERFAAGNCQDGALSWSELAQARKSTLQTARPQCLEQGRTVASNLGSSSKPGDFTPTSKGIGKGVISILHLSDLRFMGREQAEFIYDKLAESLRRDLEYPRLDVVVLSGDITNKSMQAGYDAALLFLEKLCREFEMSGRQVVLVPGNHDVCWTASHEAYHLTQLEPKRKLPEDGTFIPRGGGLIEVRNENAYKRRFDRFARFYEKIKGEPYPLEYASQGVLYHFPEENLLILGLNSAWNLDHHYKTRALINPNALKRSLSLSVAEEKYRSSRRVAVWHHPLGGSDEDRIKDHGFIQQLSMAGFQLVLHGHLHNAESNFYCYRQGMGARRLDVLGAGSFGNSVQECVPSYSLQYNLLRFCGNQLVVETRRRDYLNGVLKPDARWSAESVKSSNSSYKIDLS
ncbi:NACHT domain-containing protein [Archangium lansingense]|uniref:NACHT domain-containing protein n=1 Tax=Archangium lansingense TaxID=2995310 RepID=UPI003B7FAC16